jgi:ubiquitin-conjugating enzyme E2 J2
MAIQKSPIPYIQTHPSPENIRNWSFIITGPPSTPYSDGQYYGQLKFPINFPYGAPKIRVLTPSARFIPGQYICTTFTSMHPEEWNPAWTVETILTGFLSFMTGKDEGFIGCTRGSDTERIGNAKESKRWNSLKCEQFREAFADVHAVNVITETFTDSEREQLKAFEKECRKVECSKSAGETLLDTSYESHRNEDWEKFGSMEDDFDYYDGEEEEEEYQTSDTETESEKKQE